MQLSKKKSLDKDMTDGNIYRHLITFSLPLLVGNLFQMMYNMVDTLVVGQFVSDAAFAAVGTLTSVTNLMIGFFLGLSTGTGVVISRFFGSRNIEKVKDTVSTALIMTAVLAVVFTVGGLFLITPLVKILDMPASVEAEARTYLTIWTLGISGLMVYNMGAGIMRAVGDSRRPFIMLIICAVLNTLLDLLFVLGFGMGVEGVAIATIVAQGVSAVLVVILLLRVDSAVKIDTKRFKYDFTILKSVIRIGLPTALRMALISFSNIFVQSYINAFGEAGMGGWSAYTKIDMVVLLPMQSLSLATTTFVGQNLGKGDKKRAERGANSAFLLSLVSTVALIIPIVSFPSLFVSIFNTNPEIIEYGSLFLRLLTPFYVFWCVNQIYSGALQGSGNSLVPMIIMLASFVAFRQAYLFIVSNFVSNSPVAISICYPAGWVIAAIATLVYYKIRGLKVKNDLPAAA